MSNKQWRKPANGDKPVDPSTPVQEPAEPKPAAPKSSLTDQEAIEILDLGVKFLNNFLNLGISTLARVAPEQLRRVATEEPESPHASPQKRPRGRMHSLLLLIKFGIAATALVPRLLKCTHPHLFPTEGNRAKAANASEKFVAAVKKAMPQMTPGTA